MFFGISDPKENDFLSLTKTIIYKPTGNIILKRKLYSL